MKTETTPPEGGLELIHIDVRPPVGWLVINRPEKQNAFNLEMWREIPEKLARLEADPAVRVVILRGAGEKAFGAGADIAEFERLRNAADTAAEYDAINERAFQAVRRCSKPTIAMAFGFCVGGGLALALCADLRVGASTARFGITPAKLGLGYPFGSIETIVEELGPAAARYLFLTGRLFDAERALRLGVLHEIFDAPALEDETLKLAGVIAANAPKSLRLLKASILEAPEPAERRDHARLDRLFAECFESEDYREGLRAFREKRMPRFEDR